MGNGTNNLRYVLITPSRNEARFIEKTLESVVSQTVLPLKWVIVNDGSTDASGEIAARYAAQYSWIEIVNCPVRKERHFAAKVEAFKVGLERVNEVDYEIIGNLDADVSFDPGYFEFLLSKFTQDSRLGVAGTVFREPNGYNSAIDSFEGQTHVAGGCQVFRRECFEEIGAFGGASLNLTGDGEPEREAQHRPVEVRRHIRNRIAARNLRDQESQRHLRQENSGHPRNGTISI